MGETRGQPGDVSAGRLGKQVSSSGGLDWSRKAGGGEKQWGPGCISKVEAAGFADRVPKGCEDRERS